MVTAADIPQEQAVFTDAWNLLKEIYDIPNTEKGWSVAQEKAERYWKKYEGTEVSSFAADLLIAVLRETEQAAGRKNTNPPRRKEEG